MARANGLLAAAGYTAEAPLRFDLWHAADRYGAAEEEAARMLKAQLERSAAVRVEVRSADWASFKDQWAAGQMPAWLVGWYPDYLDADGYAAPFAGTAGSRRLGINFSNAEWDRWLAVERGSLDPATRAAAFLAAPEGVGRRGSGPSPVAERPARPRQVKGEKCEGCVPAEPRLRVARARVRRRARPPAGRSPKRR